MGERKREREREGEREKGRGEFTGKGIKYYSDRKFWEENLN